MRTLLRTTLVVALLVLSTVAWSPATAGDPPPASWPRGQHPWPKGNEWPKGETGPHAALPASPIQIESHDGAVLRGTLYRPALPLTTKAPAVVWSTPYAGNLDATTDDPDGLSGRPHPVPVSALVRQGIAVMAMNLRGTGASGGCYDFYGADEQMDQKILVEWAAAQPWSNGRVGMMGVSHDAAAAVAGAVQSPRALKAIIAATPSTDYYLWNATPQGAQIPLYTISSPAATVATQAPAISRDPSTGLAPSVAAFTEAPTDRLCTTTAEATATGVVDPVSDHRNGPFYDVRRLTDRFSDIEAAVLMTHGFRDPTVQGFANAIAWEALSKAPKAFHFDQVPHCAPTGAAWREHVVRWFAFWLQGLGEPPVELGTVRYQVSDGPVGSCVPQEVAGVGPMRTSTAWPPAEAVAERLFLAGDALAGAPATAEPAAFVAAPRSGSALPCAAATDPAASAFSTPPLTVDTDIAGNPFAELEITSSDEGGTFDARLFAVGDCDADPTTGRLLASGAVDLRFWNGNFDAVPFATTNPTKVRLDFPAMAERVRQGERVVLVLGGPETGERVSRYAPTITVGKASELVVPVVGGSTGGDRSPRTDYLPRPFLPPAG